MSSTPAPYRKPSGLLRIPGLTRRRGSLTGVCAGLARYFNVSSRWVRLAFVVATPLTSGLSLAAYAGLALLLPKENPEDDTDDPFDHAKPTQDLLEKVVPQELCPQCDTVSRPYARHCHRCGTAFIDH